MLPVGTPPQRTEPLRNGTFTGIAGQNALETAARARSEHA
jgi:hypothetical protein